MGITVALSNLNRANGILRKLENNLKDQCIGMNIKQKVRIKIL